MNLLCFPTVHGTFFLITSHTEQTQRDYSIEYKLEFKLKLYSFLGNQIHDGCVPKVILYRKDTPMGLMQAMNSPNKNLKDGKENETWIWKQYGDFHH